MSIIKSLKRWYLTTIRRHLERAMEALECEQHRIVRIIEQNGGTTPAQYRRLNKLRWRLRNVRSCYARVTVALAELGGNVFSGGKFTLESEK